MVIQVALRNEANESATILDDSILEGYKESIKKYSKNEKLSSILNQFGSSDSQLAGSGSFLNVGLVNSGLLPEDARIITREELEKIKAKSEYFLSGVYTDFGLALRTAGDSYTPNDLPAKVLADELNKRGIKLGKGKLISLNLLYLQENNDSAYGAVFKLNDKADKKTILDLADFKWGYEIAGGLACADLGRYRYWYSDSGLLGYSDGSGRVVIVSGEATSQKILSRYASKFEQEKDEAIVKANETYAERIKSLRA
jgi:hypothetical protein